ncbi:MAG TPA: trans-aconitate 2-methyltransferase [Opitutaceae bacterium]|nr:trans-aconitate 2-methyltransferase [Opitutaceae bacterium]
MPTWDSEQYLRFARERTQPAIDLALRVEVAAPARVIDLGCGPGNSTTVVAQRWPSAELAGLDNSTAMLASAREKFPQWRWMEGDIATWQPDAPYDVVFSNAALQWVPDHRRELPRLLSHVASHGALAVQMPANLEAPAHRLMREVAASSAWRSHFPSAPREWHVHPPEFYYDVLRPHATRLDLWTTDYLHVLDGVDGIIEWYRGTGLRPWLEALPDEATRTRFLGAYRARLVAYFPERADGRVLFPFHRLFIVAYP